MLIKNLVSVTTALFATVSVNSVMAGEDHDHDEDHEKIELEYLADEGKCAAVVHEEDYKADKAAGYLKLPLLAQRAVECTLCYAISTDNSQCTDAEALETNASIIGRVSVGEVEGGHVDVKFPKDNFANLECHYHIEEGHDHIHQEGDGHDHGEEVVHVDCHSAGEDDDHDDHDDHHDHNH